MPPYVAFMKKMLDTCFWILAFQREISIFFPAKEGIFDQHQATSISLLNSTGKQLLNDSN